MSKKGKTPKERALENIIEVESLEDLNKKIKQMQFKAGDPNILPKDNFNNYFIKDNLFYNKKTNDRLYPNKPEWSERALRNLPLKDIKIHLKKEILDQQTCDLLNHLIYITENE